MCDGGVKCEGSVGCDNSMRAVYCMRPTHFDTRIYMGK